MAPNCDLRQLHLGIGEVAIVERPTIIHTVLGSCVAAVFWSFQHQVGAMCHGALPTCPPSLFRGPLEPRLRYVDCAIRHLLDQIESRGVKRKEIELKLFGGADVLPVLVSPNASLTVGSQNVLAAIRTLKEESLFLKASDLGGAQTRVIYFRSDTGQVALQRLRGFEGGTSSYPAAESAGK